MSLYTVSNGTTINAADINQLVNVLAQPGGGQELGGYYLNGWGSSSGDNVTTWISSLSRLSTPVSVSVDTSVQSPVNLNSPSTNNLKAYGFHVYSTITGGSTNSAYCSGKYTIQY